MACNSSNMACVTLRYGLSDSRCVLIPLSDQSPGGLDDVAAEQCGRHVGMLGGPPSGQDEPVDYARSPSAL
jgi:hypothetical protein